MAADVIEKKIHLKAPRERVWQALTNEKEFAAWFLVEFLEGGFAEGSRVKLRAMNKGYEHVQFYMTIVKMEAPRLFSWRWIPGAELPESEATTLVEFRLEPAEGGGTLLTVNESGFNRLSLGYREKALRQNTQGWDGQAEAIAKYLETA